MKITTIQRGASCSDLIVYAHIDGSILRPVVPVVTSDAFMTVFAGAGTSAYRGIVNGADGWRGFVAAAEDALGHSVTRTCLITWSAGSQVALEACASVDPPDAVVMLDGLYASKPKGSRVGDGQVVPSKDLEAVVDFAVRAARREKTARGVERVMVVFHSRIATNYASSKECAEYVQARVEAALGERMQPATDVDATMLDGHFFAEALALGNLRVVEFAGAGAGEHIREAHLWDEASKIWVPWISGPTVCDESTAPQWAFPRVLSVTSPMMRGEDVRAWQAFIRDQGVELVADGVFGPVTRAKTEDWQRAYALPVNGTLDLPTYTTALNAGFKPGGVAGPRETVKRPSLVEGMIARAHADLGVWEELGPNDGQRIREMLKPFGIVGAANWCAAAVSDWLRRGAEDAGVTAPIAGSAGAQKLMANFKAVGRWVPASDARKTPSLVRAGMVPVWDRATPGKPETSWLGHVAVATAGVTEGSFPTVEGNSGPAGDRVAEMSRRLDDPRLFGFGFVD